MSIRFDPITTVLAILKGEEGLRLLDHASWELSRKQWIHTGTHPVRFHGDPEPEDVAVPLSFACHWDDGQPKRGIPRDENMDAALRLICGNVDGESHKLGIGNLSLQMMTIPGGIAWKIEIRPYGSIRSPSDQEWQGPRRFVFGSRASMFEPGTDGLFVAGSSDQPYDVPVALLPCRALGLLLCARGFASEIALLSENDQEIRRETAPPRRGPWKTK